MNAVSTLALAAAALAATTFPVLAAGSSDVCPIVLHDGGDAPGFSISTGGAREPNAASAEDGKGIDIVFPRNAVPFSGFQAAGELRPTTAGRSRVVVSVQGGDGISRTSVSFGGQSVVLPKRNGAATLEADLDAGDRRLVGIFTNGWEPINVEVFRVADGKETAVCANSVISAKAGLAGKLR